MLAYAVCVLPGIFPACGVHGVMCCAAVSMALTTGGAFRAVWRKFLHESEGNRASGETAGATERKPPSDRPSAPSRSVFQEMHIAAAMHEVLCNEEGIPVDFVTLDMNKACESLLNVTAADILLKKASETTSPEDFQNWLRIFGPVALGKGSVRYEVHSQELDKYFGGVAYSPVPGKVAVTFTDTTDRWRAEEALRESERKYRQLVELSPDAILLHQDGMVVYVNDAALRLFCASRADQLVGTPITERVHPEHRDQVARSIEYVLASGGATRLAIESLLTLDGVTFEAEVARGCCQFHGKQAIQVIARDVTLKRRAEKELQKLSRAVEQSPVSVVITNKDEIGRAHV